MSMALPAVKKCGYVSPYIQATSYPIVPLKDTYLAEWHDVLQTLAKPPVQTSTSAKKSGATPSQKAAMDILTKEFEARLENIEKVTAPSIQAGIRTDITNLQEDTQAYNLEKIEIFLAESKAQLEELPSRVRCAEKVRLENALRRAIGTLPLRDMMHDMIHDTRQTLRKVIVATNSNIANAPEDEKTSLKLQQKEAMTQLNREEIPREWQRIREEHALLVLIKEFPDFFSIQNGPPDNEQSTWQRLAYHDLLERFQLIALASQIGGMKVDDLVGKTITTGWSPTEISKQLSVADQATAFVESDKRLPWSDRFSSEYNHINETFIDVNNALALIMDEQAPSENSTANVVERYADKLERLAKSYEELFVFLANEMQPHFTGENPSLRAAKEAATQIRSELAYRRFAMQVMADAARGYARYLPVVQEESGEGALDEAKAKPSHDKGGKKGAKKQPSKKKTSSKATRAGERSVTRPDTIASGSAKPSVQESVSPALSTPEAVAQVRTRTTDGDKRKDKAYTEFNNYINRIQSIREEQCLDKRNSILCRGRQLLRGGG